MFSCGAVLADLVCRIARALGAVFSRVDGWALFALLAYCHREIRGVGVEKAEVRELSVRVGLFFLREMSRRRGGR